MSTSSFSTTTTNNSLSTIEQKLIIGKGLIFSDIETAIEIRKAFAEVEHRRKTFETRVKEMAEREAHEAVAEHEAQVEQAKADVQWAEGRDQRKQNWENFEEQQQQKKRKIETNIESSSSSTTTNSVPVIDINRSDALRYGIQSTNSSHTDNTNNTNPASNIPVTIPILPPEDYKRKWR